MALGEGQRRSASDLDKSMSKTNFGDDNKDLSSERTPQTVEEFVRINGGTKVIKKVLIANNGIAAVKAIRSIRRWSYETFGKDNMIEFVVMATPEDIRVNAEYIRMGEQLAKVSGGSNNHNYANIKTIIQTAEAYEVDAVWAGWGHASENPKLPDALSKKKITWIGPGAAAMHALGDKIASTLIAQSAQVPCIPWSGEGLVIDYKKEGIPKNIYLDACIESDEQVLQMAEKVGYPLMIKASEGGGGKGIRRAEGNDDVLHKFHQVQSEVPGSPIFLMQLASNCRHLEVQLLADDHGNAIALKGRDCSIQRRHQKIIEEGPVLAAPPFIWKEMEMSAVRLAREVGYVGAGTVEYLYHPPSGEYYFLELNPRLQVEHPVTELVTGVNLPAAQLLVAMGIPLNRMSQIRRFYKRGLHGTSMIDFDHDETRQFAGHVIACRITAENPDANFQPTSGSLQELNFRSTPDVWGYFSIGPHGGVHEYADSQFGHLFAAGADREKARQNMVLALKELSIRGEIRTTVEYLQRIIETEEFIDNRITTTWLEGVMARGITSEKPHTSVAVIMGSVYKGYSYLESRMEELLRAVESGRILKSHYSGLMTVPIELIYEGTKYSFILKRSGTDSFSLQMTKRDWSCEVEVHPMADGGVYVSLAGRRYVVYGFPETHQGFRIIVNSQTCTFEKEYDPSEMRTTVSGKLVKYLVEDEGHVQKGQAVYELEVMKMIIPCLAAESGIFKRRKPEGCVLESGDLIATLSLDDPSKIEKAVDFDGIFGIFDDDRLKNLNSFEKLGKVFTSIDRMLHGYCFDKERVESSLNEMMALLRDPDLALYEFEQVLSVLTGRIPESMHVDLTKIGEKFASRNAASRFFWETPFPFPVLETENLIMDFADTLAVQERSVLLLSLQPILDIIDRYRGGPHVYAVSKINSLLKNYLQMECDFLGVGRAEFLFQYLRNRFKDNPARVAELAIARAEIKSRNYVLWNILLIIEQQLAPMLAEFEETLTRIAGLRGHQYGDVAWKARQMLLLTHKADDDSQERSIALKAILSTVSKSDDIEERLIRLQTLIDQPEDLSDILIPMILTERSCIKSGALELYIRRIYRSFSLADIDIEGSTANWLFTPEQNVVKVSSPSKLGMRRIDSLHHVSLDRPREGYLFVYQDWDDLRDSFKGNIFDVPDALDLSEPVNVLHLVFEWGTRKFPPADILSHNFFHFLKTYGEQIRAKGFRRVSFLVHYHRVLHYFTYSHGLCFREDETLRHIEPTLAAQMELDRLRNYIIEHFPCANHHIHLFCADPKDKSPFAKSRTKYKGTRMFARVFDRISSVNEENISESLEYSITQTLNSIELALTEKGDMYRYNHIFLNCVSNEFFDVNVMKDTLMKILMRYEATIRRLHVSEVEMRFRVENNNYIRLMCSNPSNYSYQIEAYMERMDCEIPIFEPLLEFTTSTDLRFSGLPVDAAHSLTNKFQLRRELAAVNQTTWVYDFVELIQEGLMRVWMNFNGQEPEDVLSVTELILDEKNELIETSRPIGMNDCGMIAWKMTMKTPEYPQGRELILIANDITYLAGSFGPKEDMLFDKASKLSRELGIPRLYFAANSGARIGLCKELQVSFKVSWVENDPVQGFEYLYLSEEDYNKITDRFVTKRHVTENGEVRHIITDIIGTYGIGVENLSGSGMIAGETSRAYDEVFTLNYIAGRCVGIGAYLVRLGQRIIQKVGQPILLTGYRALNKLLGKEVYTSNSELGGTGIMYPNGVTHQVVHNDMEGVMAVLKWLSYVPKDIYSLCHVPSLDSIADPVDREVISSEDIRSLIDSMFDTGSFEETLGGWAQTIVAGRARLGGIAVGILSVERDSKEKRIYADPANAESKEMLLSQAGQVWYPDSSHKASQTIFDLNREGLPLFILANWRGFSGGMRDMFEEILKFGSHIVDGLRQYRQPVFVYLVPGGELRGGAWVVVDPTINPRFMEMYADPSSRGGILEPSGAISVKYKPKQVLETAHRLDDVLQELDEKCAVAEGETKQEILKMIRERESRVYPSFLQVATKFADLHDTPGRMHAVNCISEIVPAEKSREFFYWRLRLRLEDVAVYRECDGELKDVLKRLDESLLELDNRELCLWIDENRESLTGATKKIRDDANIARLVKDIESLSPANRAALLKILQ